MKANDWLRHATKQLREAGIATARLDSLVLLADALQQDKSAVLAHAESTLQPATLLLLNKQIKRRITHEPLAYIRGKSEFYGREFMVNKHTLEPRPETETMIALLKSLINSQKPPLQKDGPLSEKKNVNWEIIDVGTGSGCIGVTAKLEFPDTEVIATDVSRECIEIARENAKKFGAAVAFYEADLLEQSPIKNRKHMSIVLANLPYVPDAHTINQAAMQEPKLAIFGGVDGLDIYRRLFKQLEGFKQKPQFVLTESLPFQHPALAGAAKSYGYQLQTTEDFIQVFSC